MYASIEFVAPESLVAVCAEEKEKAASTGQISAMSNHAKNPGTCPGFWWMGKAFDNKLQKWGQPAQWRT